MSNITIPKTEYLKLKRQAEAYKRLSGRFFESVIKDSVEEVIKDFRKTSLYSQEFLSDLESGLKKSSFREK
ncbi:hypothetical protein C4572_03615 [Candidatus Parcubacteria bacterium]|nr:MAG: hypothetical protein C4572_03615 [Candidatus Parcubacteria bacterium]